MPLLTLSPPPQAASKVDAATALAINLKKWCEFEAPIFRWVELIWGRDDLLLICIETGAD